VTDTVKADVVVIGGGAAGSLAALAAARAGGVGVALVGGLPGATALSSGAVDLAGEVGLTSLTSVREAFGRLAVNHPASPLARLPVDEGERLAREVARVLCAEGPRGDERPRLYGPRELDQPHQLAATALGQVHPAWLCQVGQANLRAWPGRTIGIADVAGSGLPAWLVADQLGRAAAAAKLDQSFEPVEVTLPDWLDPGRPLVIARRLDEDEAALSRLGRALADAIKTRPVDLMLVPPWAGIERAPQVIAALSAAVGVPVLETLGRPGESPGLRLQRLLERATAAAGVERITGRAVAFAVESDRVLSVEVRGGPNEVTVEAGAFVMATGGLAGGGIELGRTAVEPLLGLPLELDGRALEPPSSQFGADRAELFAPHPAASHPICRAGVAVDESQRPVRGGAPSPSNLFVAGAMLAGYDPLVGRSGLGAALITGVRAGELAAKKRKSD
jgi:glycerol-3-phosphate dehydrogenase subunit B